MKVQVYGQLISGQIKINSDYLRAQLRTKKDCDITLTVESTGARSNQQNAYWWGVVVPHVAQGLQDVSGETWSNEETHMMLKLRFIPMKNIVNKDTGEVIMGGPGSTANLSTFNFANLIDNVLRFAAEYLGVNIPLPNEQQLTSFNEAQI